LLVPPFASVLVDWFLWAAEGPDLRQPKKKGRDFPANFTLAQVITLINCFGGNFY